MGELAQALGNLEEKKVYELIDKQISDGMNPLEIVQECNEGMTRVGELYSEQKYFISQLIYSAEILKQVMQKLDPLLAGVKTAGGDGGKVVIGTVKGDIHDIGKNIVITLLKGSGFEVLDLGVDVPPDKFVQAVKDSGAKVVGLSALLNFTYPVMKDVVDALIVAGLRDKVKVMVGGAPVDADFAQRIGADGYGSNAPAGADMAKQLVGAA